MTKVDMHVHSHYSDGFDSIEEIFKRAKTNGVQRISIVDHDTVDSFDQAFFFGRKYQIDVIPGIEISAYDYKRNRKVHILGYSYQPEAIHIKNACQSVLERRHAHSLWQLEQLSQAGYPLDVQVALRNKPPNTPFYKQHIMHQLTTKSYTSQEYKELYTRLFKGNGIASGDIEYIDVFMAVEAIRSDGGMAVVAHPGQLKSYDVIPELVERGLNGIERNHPDHTPTDHEKVEELSNKFGLFMTGGTDYHGIFGSPVEIGSFTSPPLTKI